MADVLEQRVGVAIQPVLVEQRAVAQVLDALAACVEDACIGRVSGSASRLQPTTLAAFSSGAPKCGEPRQTTCRTARDRLAAQKICDALLRQLAIAETDQLTGARTRAAGLADVDRKIARACRARGLLVAVYVDVVGLKIVNDARGHAAGDALLARVVHEVRAHLRRYDVIVRLGGDEFLCVMPGVTIGAARRRFSAIQAALAADPDPSKIKCGFAELGRDDSTAELVGRADAELPISAPR